MENSTFLDIRLYKGMTQKAFADWLGVSLPSVGMIESGHRDVSSNIKGKLAHKFAVTEEFVEYQQRKSSLGV